MFSKFSFCFCWLSIYRTTVVQTCVSSQWGGSTDQTALCSDCIQYYFICIMFRCLTEQIIHERVPTSTSTNCFSPVIYLHCYCIFIYLGVLVFFARFFCTHTDRFSWKIIIFHIKLKCFKLWRAVDERYLSSGLLLWLTTKRAELQVISNEHTR